MFKKSSIPSNSILLVEVIKGFALWYSEWLIIKFVASCFSSCTTILFTCIVCAACEGKINTVWLVPAATISTTEVVKSLAVEIVSNAWLPA